MSWSKSEIDFLLENYLKISTKEMATILNRDYSSTKRAVKKFIYNNNELNILTGFIRIEESPIHAISEDGIIIRIKTRKIIKSALDKKGYSIICLQNKKTFKVHRLVAKYFVPNPNNLPQVNHIDGIKTNNHYSNLEWCTNTENRNHAITSGLWKNIGTKVSQLQKGENNSSAKLTEREILEIYKDKKSGKSHSEIANKWNISSGHVSFIVNGKSWNHLYLTHFK